MIEHFRYGPDNPAPSTEERIAAVLAERGITPPQSRDRRLAEQIVDHTEARRDADHIETFLALAALDD